MRDEATHQAVIITMWSVLTPETPPLATPHAISNI